MPNITQETLKNIIRLMFVKKETDIDRFYQTMDQNIQNAGALFPDAIIHNRALEIQFYRYVINKVLTEEIDSLPKGPIDMDQESGLFKRLRVNVFQKLENRYGEKFQKHYQIPNVVNGIMGDIQRAFLDNPELPAATYATTVLSVSSPASPASPASPLSPPPYCLEEVKGQADSPNNTGFNPDEIAFAMEVSAAEATPQAKSNSPAKLSELPPPYGQVRPPPGAAPQAAPPAVITVSKSALLTEITTSINARPFGIMAILETHLPMDIKPTVEDKDEPPAFLYAKNWDLQSNGVPFKKARRLGTLQGYKETPSIEKIKKATEEILLQKIATLPKNVDKKTFDKVTSEITTEIQLMGKNDYTTEFHAFPNKYLENTLQAIWDKLTFQFPWQQQSPPPADLKVKEVKAEAEAPPAFLPTVHLLQDDLVCRWKVDFVRSLQNADAANNVADKDLDLGIALSLVENAAQQKKKEHADTPKDAAEAELQFALALSESLAKNAKQPQVQHKPLAKQVQPAIPAFTPTFNAQPPASVPSAAAVKPKKAPPPPPPLPVKKQPPPPPL